MTIIVQEQKMKLKTLSALCLASTALMATSTAMAWESADGQHMTSASVELATDYRFRGISFSDNKPAVSGSLDYEHAIGLYAGIWSSSIDGGSEFNIYGGFASEFGDSGVGYDVGILRYIFPGDSGANNNEVYGSLSYSFFTAGIAYDHSWEGNGESAMYYSLGFDYDLPYEMALFASYGYTDFSSKLKREVDAGASGYADWSIGLTKNMAGFDWTLAYIDTDSDARKIYRTSDYAGLSKSSSSSTVVLSIGKTF